MTETPPGPMEMQTLSFGDVRFRVSSADTSLRLHAPGPVHRFAVAGEGADVSLTARWADLRDRDFGTLLFDSGGVWKMYSSKGRYHCVCSSPNFGSNPYKVASFDTDFSSGDILLHRPFFPADAPVYPLEHPLDEVLLNHLLGAGNGAAIHSVGLLDAGGRGLLFAGQSGAGKSTTARLWKAHAKAILSDERIILRQRGDEIRMYGTPWVSDAGVCAASEVPLHAVFFLRHGKANRLVRLSPRDVAAKFLTCAFVPFYRAEFVAYTLKFYEDVALRVPCFELTFPPDGSAVAFVEEHLESISVLDGIEDNHE